jgi:hypothetical protein
MAQTSKKKTGGGTADHQDEGRRPIAGDERDRRAADPAPGAGELDDEDLLAAEEDDEEYDEDEEDADQDEDFDDEIDDKR